MVSPVKIWRNQKKVRSLLGKTGQILSWTMIYIPPSGFSDQAPYPVALILFEDGTKMTAQLVDLPAGRQVGKEYDLKGMQVITVIRRVLKPDETGVIPYGIKVKPI